MGFLPRLTLPTSFFMYFALICFQLNSVYNFPFFVESIVLKAPLEWAYMFHKKCSVRPCTGMHDNFDGSKLVIQNVVVSDWHLTATYQAINISDPLKNISVRVRYDRRQGWDMVCVREDSSSNSPLRSIFRPPAFTLSMFAFIYSTIPNDPVAYLCGKWNGTREAQLFLWRLQPNHRHPF